MFSRLYTLVVVGLMTGGGVLATPVASGDLSARQTFTGTCVEPPLSLLRSHCTSLT
jgi:hypothetical protein